MKNWWKGNFDYFKAVKICWFISLGILVLGVIFNLIFGTQLDVSFHGGNELQYSYTGDLDTNTLRDSLQNSGFSTVTVRTAESAGISIVKISIPGEALTMDEQTTISELFESEFADNQLDRVDSQSLSPTMGTMFLWKCLLAIVLAAAFLLIYVGIRFRKIGGWTAAVMAIAALVHDLVVVYFSFVIFQIPLNDNFVAVMLAILGYSLNNTIVIFDRIRENRALKGKSASINEMVNLSLNQSVRRNVSTTVSTVMAVGTVAVVAVVLNLESIISFSVPLLFGLLSGFYSSQFLCTPTWSLWEAKREAKQAAAGKSGKKSKSSKKSAKSKK